MRRDHGGFFVFGIVGFAQAQIAPGQEVINGFGTAGNQSQSQTVDVAGCRGIFSAQKRAPGNGDFVGSDGSVVFYHRIGIGGSCVYERTGKPCVSIGSLVVNGENAFAVRVGGFKRVGFLTILHRPVTHGVETNLEGVAVPHF